MGTNLIKFIGKYLAIGVLVGLGIILADLLTWEYRQNVMSDALVNFEEHLLEIRDIFYIEGMESVFSDPKKYDPSMGLHFSLEGYELLEDKIRVRGVVTNTGNSIWSGVFFEIEAFSNGEIIAECNEFGRSIEPGHWEAIISECPLVEEFIGAEVSAVTFKIKKAFLDKKIIKPHNKPFKSDTGNAGAP